MCVFFLYLACQLGPYVPATDCTKTCGNGTQQLNRTCYNIAITSSSVPQPCSNTSLCDTYNISTGSCNTDVCISKYQNKVNRYWNFL
jgi:hypothetical protein